MKRETLIQAYFTKLNEYKEKYGERTTLLLQKGGFYEIYDIEEEGKSKNGLMNMCENIMHIGVGCVNGQKEEIGGYDNPRMAGFPIASLEKYLPLLLRAGYTVVEMVEDGTDEDNQKRRIVKYIHSQTTSRQYESCEETNLLSVYVEDLKKNKLIGVSVMDVKSGKSQVYQFYDVEKEQMISSVIEVIHSIQPKEILISSNLDTEHRKEEIIEMLKLSMLNASIYYQHYEPYNKASFQNEFLSTIFTNTKREDALSYIGLNKYQEVATSYVYMLRYVYDHDNGIVVKLEKPKIYNRTRYVSLSDRGVYNLNLLSNNHLEVKKGEKNDSLFSVINMTSTSMGERLLKNKIRLPIYDVKKLEKSYSRIDDIIDTGYDQYIPILKTFCDIDRLQRNMAIGSLSPQQFVTMNMTLKGVLELVRMVKKTGKKSLTKLLINDKRLERFIKEYSKVIDIEKLEKSIGKKFEFIHLLFKPSVCEEIDNKRQETLECSKKIKDVIEEISRILGTPVKTVQLPSGIQIRLSKKRAQNLKDELKKNTILNYDDFLWDSRLKSTIDVTSKQLSEWSLQESKLYQELEELIQKLYKSYVCKWYKKYYKLLNKISNFISNFDVLISYAKVSKIYKYTKPVINTENNTSFIKATNMRNPIVERIVQRTKYIPIDLDLGTLKTCILLYGINTSGKSTILRTTGLNVILAQIGCFVPADSFIFYPYTHIMTKMNNEDNFYMGHSTFDLEMQQLKSMFNLIKSHSNSSLLLGDEIASGTETHSAVSILASALIFLCKSNINTIFTSHYHELMTLDEVKSLKQLDIKHIEIEVDNGELVYTRKIKNGSGPSNYGIRIATLLNMHKEFIFLAKEINDKIRHKVTVSKYNKDLYMTKCAICNSQKSLDTHHIDFQRNADENSMVGTIHKNTMANLVVLCKKCHVKLHKGKININGYIETENGPKLCVDYN